MVGISQLVGTPRFNQGAIHQKPLSRKKVVTSLIHFTAILLAHYLPQCFTPQVIHIGILTDMKIEDDLIETCVKSGSLGKHRKEGILDLKT